MQSIHDLRHHSAAQGPHEILEFIAISCPDATLHDTLQTLSPKTMHWADDLWLIDMRACRMFWQKSAERQGLDATRLIHQQLEAIFAGRAIYGAAASTPWEALLLAKAVKDKGFSGIIALTSRLGSNLLRGLSWESWWESCLEHAVRTNVALPKFNAAKNAMTLAMQRLGCRTPDQLRALPGPHLRRRFRVFVAEVWQLSFPERQGLPQDEAIRAFPWEDHQTQDRPCVKRHLDHELSEWDVIEELLREDLNRLCVLSSFKKEERILDLEWRIVLCDLHMISIPIPFRHPHSLHQDCPSQRTALLQIHYAFELYVLSRASANATGLISWQLEIVGKAPARFRQASLFHESSDDLHTLRQLENMIKRPLESFALSGDWLAEDSFHAETENDPHPMIASGYQMLAEQRPLFLYGAAQDLSCTGLTEVDGFLERTMDKWWKSSNRSRDYYRMRHEDAMLWVYRDQQGGWHAQGVYG